MQIIAGKARSLTLEVPGDDLVRPTAGRARKALFDSLGSFAGARVADLFAGSGALGLESASRGAESILFVEESAHHAAAIERNIARVLRTGVAAHTQIYTGSAFSVRHYAGRLPEVDLIFADPPYAKSVAFFETLVRDENFAEWAAEALLVWEIPDIPGSTGHFLKRDFFESSSLRTFGRTEFLIGMVKARKSQ